MPNMTQGVFFGLIALIVWGVSDFIATHAIRKIGSVKTFFWSQLVGLVLYSSLFLVFISKIPQISLLDVLLIIAMTITITGAYFSYYKGFRIGKVVNVSPVVNSWPIVTLFFAITILGQDLNKLQGAAVLMVLFGAVMISYKIHDLLKLNFRNSANGIGYAAIGAFLFGVAFAVMDPLVISLGIFLPILLSKFIQVPLTYGYLKILKIDLKFPFEVALPLILVGCLDFIGLVTYSLAIESEFTALIAPLMAAVPMVTVLLARIFYKEELEYYQWIGVFFIISAVGFLSV